MCAVLCLQQDLSAAVRFYSHAQCYSSAIRLAKASSRLSQQCRLYNALSLHLYMYICVCVCARTRVCNGGVPCDAGTLSIQQEAGLEPELMNLALMSSPREMLDAARWVGLKRTQEQCVAHARVWLVDCRYFEGSLDTVDRAIILYHKVGEQ